MDKNSLIFSLGHSMWDFADLSKQEFCKGYHERCIKNMHVDVFLDNDIDEDEDFVAALDTKQPRIRFYCTLCYEDYDSSDLLEMCDDESGDLYVVANELKKYDPYADSMLYIDSYELHTDVFYACDIQRIMDMLPEFVYNRMNILPEYVAMLHPTNASYNMDCYPIGIMNLMVELDSGVFIREVECKLYNSYVDSSRGI